MSTGGDRPRDNSPSQRSTGSRRPSRGRHRPGPPSIIEFVDSHDPNKRSAIQRHTAYHSAAQRREAQLQSLRRGSQPRYLDWGRRQGTEPSPESSSSQPPGSPRTLSGTDFTPSDHNLSRQPSRDTSLPALTSEEEAILEFCRFYLRIQHQALTEGSAERQALLTLLASIDAEPEPMADFTATTQEDADSQAYDTVIAMVRLDDTCTQLLLAYCFSLRAKLQQIEGVGEPSEEAAQRYLGQGTAKLRNRLMKATSASSDVNIQAVLMLLSYASDFGEEEEVNIHADALRTMVGERGGLDALSDNTVLHRQLIAADSARKFHLTLGCGPTCEKDRRFPQGFWGARQ